MIYEVHKVECRNNQRNDYFVLQKESEDSIVGKQVGPFAGKLKAERFLEKCKEDSTYFETCSPSEAHKSHNVWYNF